MKISIQKSEPWYHGSDKAFTLLREGSTVTQWRALAEAFARQPTRLEYGDDGTIVHNGVKNGLLYRIDEPVTVGVDLIPHPRTTMDEGAEFLTLRPLRVKRITR